MATRRSTRHPRSRPVVAGASSCMRKRPLPLQMGLAAAEAVVRGGYTLVPYTLTGASRGIAVENQAVAGIPVEVVGHDVRQDAMEDIRRQYPNLIIIDFTLPR